jgi:hypothetical protein
MTRKIALPHATPPTTFPRVFGSCGTGAIFNQNNQHLHKST